MPVIQCKVGAVSTPVRGTYYNFERNRHGHYVCTVNDEKDAAIFLSGAVPYQLYDDPESTTALTPVQPPSPPSLPDASAELRELLVQAVAPLLEQRGEEVVCLKPWPALVPVSDALLRTPQPWFSAGDGQMVISLANGAATYQIKGTVDDTHLYALLEGSTWSDPGPSPDAADDEDEDDEADDEDETKPGSEPAATVPPDGTAPATVPVTDKPQLDHDGDGKPGGSLPRATTSRRKKAAKPAAA